MKIVKAVIILTAFLFLASSLATAQPVAFTNVTIIDVEEGVAKPDMHVIVAGDRITAVGSVDEIDVPDRATIIDGTGKYLIPGLWDMHAHTTTDRNTREIIFPLLIAQGVTGIRSMAADCFETGEPNCEEEGSSATLATIEDVRRYFVWAEETYARDLGDPAERAPHSRWVREFTGGMHQAGVRILAGSDAGETGIFWGIGLHQELELLADAGMTEAEALRAATLGPAQFLERTDSQGTVEEEKVADLILLDANPLEDIRNTQKIRAVVANGRYFDRQALDQMLSEAEKAANPQEGNNPKPKK